MAKSPQPAPEAEPMGKPIVSLRGAVILLLSFITGGVAGGLTYVGDHHVAQAVLASLTAAAAAVWWFDRFIA